jgi:hypothetical protein
MVGGTPRFIAEIPCRGKLNLPADFFHTLRVELRVTVLPLPFFAPRIFCLRLFRYFGTLVPDKKGEVAMADDKKLNVERVQTGVRMEERILKVLKAFAEYHDLTLGDLLEGIVLHAFDGKCPFGAESLKRIKDLKKFYGLDLDSRASHRLTESRPSPPPGKRQRRK